MVSRRSHGSLGDMQLGNVRAGRHLCDVVLFLQKQTVKLDLVMCHVHGVSAVLVEPRGFSSTLGTPFQRSELVQTNIDNLT
jgi:hypothetical protein